MMSVSNFIRKFASYSSQLCDQGHVWSMFQARLATLAISGMDVAAITSLAMWRRERNSSQS